MTREWLSLHDAAEILGVHPSTVRAWADKGYLPLQRTQGGHRRFRRADVELWLRMQQEDTSFDPGLIAQDVLSRTRLQITEGGIQMEGWYQKLDEEARQQYRLSGRAMLQGLISQMKEENAEIEAEARSLGYEYASRGQRCGLSSVEAVRAFLFFRNIMLDSLIRGYESAGIRSPQAWSEMYRRINHFTDMILTTLLETYEAYQRGLR